MRDVTAHKPWRNVGALSTRYNLGPSVQPPLWNNIDVDQYPQQRRYGINIEDDRGITISRSREKRESTRELFSSIEFLGFIDRFRYFDRRILGRYQWRTSFPFHFSSLFISWKIMVIACLANERLARWRTKHITDCLYLHVGVVGACFS